MNETGRYSEHVIVDSIDATLVAVKRILYRYVSIRTVRTCCPLGRFFSLALQESLGPKTDNFEHALEILTH